MIHHLAHVDVPVGEGTTVWQFASVIRDASVGRGCTIGAYALIDAARIGDRCLVGSGAQLHPGLFAGDEVFFGPGCIACNDPWPRARKGDFDIAALLSREFVTVRIGSGASIGCGAILLPGVEIGDNAMVAAGSVVRRSVPADHLHKRDGTVVEIGRRPVTRMREAGSGSISSRGP